MKLLWTISNWKRTGPLEPSLDLAAAVQAAGHEVQVAVGRPPSGRDAEAEICAADRGLATADTGAALRKHSSPLRDRADIARLKRFMRGAGFDAVVTTLRNDHRLLLGATRKTDTPVLRLWFEDGTAPLERRDAVALRSCDGVLVFSRAAETRLSAAGVRHVRRTAPPLDIATVRSRASDDADERARHGVAADTFLFGIVARLQLHRRFEILWDAVEALKAKGVPFHLLVVGRGTNQEEVGHRPVADRGLGDHVTFTGYLRGDAYVNALQAMQAQIFLVPGSDPTCRALREGMSLGVPSIATRRGMLREIVADGESGLLVHETGPSLATAMEGLVTDPNWAVRLGAAARVRAECFDASRSAAKVIEAIEFHIDLRHDLR